MPSVILHILPDSSKGQPWGTAPPPPGSPLLPHLMYSPNKDTVQLPGKLVLTIWVCSLSMVSAPGAGFSAVATPLNVLGTFKNPAAGLAQPIGIQWELKVRPGQHE